MSRGRTLPIRTTHGSLRLSMPVVGPTSVRRQPNFFNSSLYEPRPKSPDSLTGNARKQWDYGYRRAKSMYGGVGDTIPNLDEVSRRSAWRSLDALESDWPEDQVLPEPGPCIGLGRMIEYAFIDSIGNLQIRSFASDDDPPEVYWDHKNKRIYCFPHIRQTSCSRIPNELRGAAEHYKTWSKREPKCYDELEIPDDLVIVPVGMADSITYRSDKWEKRSNSKGLIDGATYIHDHGPKVWTWQDDDPDDGLPQVIMIQGGRLDMHAKGLIH